LQVSAHLLHCVAGGTGLCFLHDKGIAVTKLDGKAASTQNCKHVEPTRCGSVTGTCACNHSNDNARLPSQEPLPGITHVRWVGHGRNYSQRCVGTCLADDMNQTRRKPLHWPRSSHEKIRMIKDATLQIIFIRWSSATTYTSHTDLLHNDQLPFYRLAAAAPIHSPPQFAVRNTLRPSAAVDATSPGI
jgi:hypothetical protein